MIQNFHLGSSFSGSRFFHRLRDKQKEGVDLRYDILHKKKKNYVFKSRMNKLVFSLIISLFSTYANHLYFVLSACDTTRKACSSSVRKACSLSPIRPG